MAYTDNLLSKNSADYTLNNASITDGKLIISAGGSAIYNVPQRVVDTLSDDYMMRIYTDGYVGDDVYAYRYIVYINSQDTTSETIKTHRDKFVIYPMNANGTEYHFSIAYDKPLSIQVIIESDAATQIASWELYNEVTASDVQVEIDELKEAVADANASYYFYSNPNQIAIPKGTIKDICTINFRANKQAYIIFDGTFILNCDFPEEYDQSVDTYTYDDALLKLYFYVNATLIQTQVHKATAFVEPYLLTTTATLRNGNNTSGILTIKLEAITSDTVIEIGGSHGYLTTKNFEYKDFNIDVTNMPAKISYFSNELLDYSGLVVSKLYSDGTSEPITTQCKFTPPNGSLLSDYADFSKASYYTLEVFCTYEELNYWGEMIQYVASFELDVEQYAPDDMIITNPTKMSYKAGEAWDYTGLEVKIRYTDGSIHNVTNYSVYPTEGTPYDPSVTTRATITWSASPLQTLQDYIDTDFIDVDDVIIDTLPDKIDYVDGDTWDYSGIAVSAKYSDSTVIDVTNICNYIPANGTMYNGANTTVGIARYTPIGQTPLQNYFETNYAYSAQLCIIDEPDVLSYRNGQQINYDGLNVGILYINNTIEPVNNYSLSIPNGSLMPNYDVTSTISYNLNGDILDTDLDFYLIDNNSIDLADLPGSIAGAILGGDVYKNYDTGKTIFAITNVHSAISLYKYGYNKIIVTTRPIRDAYNGGGRFNYMVLSNKLNIQSNIHYHDVNYEDAFNIYRGVNLDVVFSKGLFSAERTKNAFNKVKPLTGNYKEMYRNGVGVYVPTLSPVEPDWYTNPEYNFSGNVTLPTETTFNNFCMSITTMHNMHIKAPINARYGLDIVRPCLTNQNKYGYLTDDIYFDSKKSFCRFRYVSDLTSASSPTYINNIYFNDSVTFASFQYATIFSSFRGNIYYPRNSAVHIGYDNSIFNGLSLDQAYIDPSIQHGFFYDYYNKDYVTPPHCNIYAGSFIVHDTRLAAAANLIQY